MTEREAASAAANPSDSRNLVMRIAVAAVLIPLAIAIAYAGGWLWTALVTLAAIGLFLEWLAIVGLAGATRVTVPGVTALAVAGLCFAIGRLDVALIVLGIGRRNRGGCQHQSDSDTDQKITPARRHHRRGRGFALGHDPVFAAKPPKRRSRLAYSAIAPSSAALSKSGQWIGTNTSSL